jgi:2-hydroxy-6-oxonona-2,4-dienedioate hydrolase
MATIASDAGTPAAFVARVDAHATRRLTPCGDGAMVWREWGAGRPLVLLHGASGSWTHWIRNIAALAAHVRVLVPDLPGFGDSAPPPEPATLDTLADVVARGIDAVVPPPEPVDMAGFSFGGIVAGVVAARHDARVRSLTLVGPNGMALRRRPLPSLVRIEPTMTVHEVATAHRENLRTLMFGRPERADDLAVHVQLGNLRRARFRSGAIPDGDALLRALPAIRARLAGIWGERDAFAAPYIDDRRRTLERFQPGLAFHVVPDAGHWVMYEAPEDVNRILLATVAP